MRMLPLTLLCSVYEGLSYPGGDWCQLQRRRTNPFLADGKQARGFRLLKRITGICVPVFSGSWKMINLSRMLSGADLAVAYNFYFDFHWCNNCMRI